MRPRLFLLAAAVLAPLAACKGPQAPPAPATALPAPAMATQTAPVPGMAGATWSFDGRLLVLAQNGVDQVRMTCQRDRLIAFFGAVTPVGDDRDLKFGPAGALLATVPVPEIPPPGLTAMVPLPTPIVDRMADWPALEASYHGQSAVFPMPPKSMTQAFVRDCNAKAAAARAG